MRRGALADEDRLVKLTNKNGDTCNIKSQLAVSTLVSMAHTTRIIREVVCYANSMYEYVKQLLNYTARKKHGVTAFV